MENSSNLSDCYQILGLSPNATASQIKEAYRRLAKQYHPDLNPGDRQAADRFVQIQQSYETLLVAIEQQAQQSPADSSRSRSTSSHPAVKVSVKKRPEQSPPAVPNLSPEQERIKRRSLQQINELLRQRQWQRAMRQADDLARRLPHQPDIARSQAKAYHGWGRELIDRRRYDEARDYLQKAMKIDSTNRWLWEEIERDYIRIERGLRLL